MSYNLSFPYQALADPILPLESTLTWVPAPNQPPPQRRVNLALYQPAMDASVLYTPPHTVYADSWYAPWSEPVRSKRVPLQGEYAFVTYVAPIRFEVKAMEWFMAWSEPVRPTRRTPSYYQGLYVGEPIAPPPPPPTPVPDAAGWTPELPVDEDWVPDDPL